MLVSFESLFIFPFIGTLFVTIAWQERAQSDYIRRKVIILGAISKNKCSKLAPLFEIQHDVYMVSEDFGTMKGQWVYVYAHKRKTKHKT